MQTTLRSPTGLTALDSLPAETIRSILDRAQDFLPIATGDEPALDSLRGRIVANLFFEDSTRTRASFTVAAKRLGADTLEFSGAGSSLSKGETILDTAKNIQAMGFDAIVVRSAQAGAAHLIASHLDCSVINAGDGRHEHPTQGLLDLLTIQQRFDRFDHLTVAIVGDIANSRVARSAIHGLTTLGANVILSGPPDLVPRTFEQILNPEFARGNVTVNHEMDEVIEQVDVVMMLRIQFERSGGGTGAGTIAGDYRALHGLTAKRAARLRPDAIIMHPGPINRGLEMDGEVADDAQRSVIMQQVTNGVAVRMAVLERALSHEQTRPTR